MIERLTNISDTQHEQTRLTPAEQLGQIAETGAQDSTRAMEDYLADNYQRSAIELMTVDSIYNIFGLTKNPKNDKKTSRILTNVASRVNIRKNL